MKPLKILLFVLSLFILSNRLWAYPLKFDKLVYDFGQVDDNQRLSCKFEFENESKDTLYINIQDTCQCFRIPIQKSSTKILPFMKGEIKVLLVYDSHKLGILNKSVKIVFNKLQNIPPIYLKVSAEFVKMKDNTKSNKEEKRRIIDSIKVAEKLNWETKGIPDPSKFVMAIKPVPINMEIVKDSIGYPKTALTKGLEDDIVLQILVDENGNYMQHFVLSGIYPELIAAVEKYVKNLRFKPATQGNKPIKYWITVPFGFKLIGLPLSIEITCL